MAFKDIKGHNRITVLLQRAIIADRISHSYLFVGPESTGKKTTALNFAKTLNCKKPRYYEKELVDACEGCKNCKRINSSNHPAVTIIEPLENSIKIEQVKNMQETVYFKPVDALWHVIIIDKAEAMTNEAANCILKLLEEPPSYVIFLLLAINEFLLPATVVSRCQLFRFNLLSPQILKDLLQDMPGINEEKASLYSSIANGRVDRALDLIKKKNLEQFRGNIIDLVTGTKGEHIWKVSTEKDKINIVKLNIYKNSEKNTFAFPSKKLDLFFDFVLMWYRDLLIFKMLKARDKLINIDKLRIIRNEVEDMELEEIYSLIENVTKFKDSLRKNVNSRLVMENFVSIL